MDILIILSSFIVAMGLTALTRRFLLNRNLLDHPNERSSHSQPVPRGGGWAFMPILIPGLTAAALNDHALFTYAGLIGGVVLLAAISWLDDRRGVSARARLSLHLLAACLGSLCLPSDFYLLQGWLPFAADRAVLIVGWAWFINLYNFMDGIDGITAAETISIATGVCLLLTALGAHQGFTPALCLILTGCCLGFLVFNWHPAKIFLGDVGSVPLGYLTGFALLKIAVEGHLAAALILPLYYLADSGITIARRALRGEKIWQAHRQHFYQRAAQGAGRHDTVVFYILAANAALIALALWSLTRPLPAFGLAVLTVALLLWKMHKLSHASASP